MKKILINLSLTLAFVLTSTFVFAYDLNFHQVYKLTRTEDTDGLMKIWYHIKYTLFAKDYRSTGTVLFIDKSGFMRTRKFLRQRIVLGKEGLAYKDLVMFTEPSSVKGLGTLTWTYLDTSREQDVWLWLPSLRKIRKISASQADDSFLGSDFTVEEITTRRLEDETYILLGEEKFKGYTSKVTNKTYFKGKDCFVVEAKPKRENWYYSKRVIWLDKETGGLIYDEVYDPLGKLYKTIFREIIFMSVDGKDYATQAFLEVKDLRTQHQTDILFEDIKYDQNLDEGQFSEKTLRRSKW